MGIIPKDIEDEIIEREMEAAHCQNSSKLTELIKEYRSADVARQNNLRNELAQLFYTERWDLWGTTALSPVRKICHITGRQLLEKVCEVNWSFDSLTSLYKSWNALTPDDFDDFFISRAQATGLHGLTCPYAKAAFKFVSEETRNQFKEAALIQTGMEHGYKHAVKNLCFGISEQDLIRAIVYQDSEISVTNFNLFVERNGLTLIEWVSHRCYHFELWLDTQKGDEAQFASTYGQVASIIKFNLADYLHRRFGLINEIIKSKAASHEVFRPDWKSLFYQNWKITSEIIAMLAQFEKVTLPRDLMAQLQLSEHQAGRIGGERDITGHKTPKIYCYTSPITPDYHIFMSEQIIGALIYTFSVKRKP